MYENQKYIIMKFHVYVLIMFAPENLRQNNKIYTKNKEGKSSSTFVNWSRDSDIDYLNIIHVSYKMPSITL